MKRSTLKTLVALAALAAFGSAGAQVQERTFKLGLQNPKGHPLEMGAAKFAELVAQFIVMFLLVLFPQLVMVPLRLFY